MNKERRKRLSEASDLIIKAQTIVEEVKDEEEEAYDNLPEQFQNGERGEQMQEYISLLEEVYDHCDDMTSIIDEI
jgi:RecB family exonuclease